MLLASMGGFCDGYDHGRFRLSEIEISDSFKNAQVGEHINVNRLKYLLSTDYSYKGGFYDNPHAESFYNNVSYSYDDYKYRSSFCDIICNNMMLTFQKYSASWWVLASKEKVTEEELDYWDLHTSRFMYDLVTICKLCKVCDSLCKPKIRKSKKQYSLQFT